MRGALVALLALCLLGQKVASSDRDRTPQEKVLEPASPANVTASVKSVEYCKGDSEIYAAHLHLRLELTNLSAGNLILYEPKKAIEIVSGVVGANVRALEEKQYEVDLAWDQFVEPPRIAESERPDANLFAVIPAGGSHQLTGEVTVLVRFKASPHVPGTVAHGDHAMIVDVNDWPFGIDSAGRLQAKWARYGLLSSNTIRSQPFVFSIPSEPELKDCSVRASVRE